MLALAAGVLLWSIAMFAKVRSDYLGYRLARFDLGNMVQAVWSTTQGRLLENTTGFGEQVSRLGGHVDPILVLLAPLWMVVPSPLTLAAAQIAAVALGAVPVYLLGVRHASSERVGLLLAGAYLLNPWLIWTTLDAVHPVTLAIPLLLFAVWLLDVGRLGWFAICAVLAAATGELMGLTIAALGVWYALARGRRRVGALIAGAGVAWTLVALLVVVPAFSGGSSRFYGFYEGVGGSPSGMVRTAASDPFAILGELLDGNVLLYIVALGLPLAGVFLLAPWLAAVALPQLALNALADPVGPIDPRQHYLAAIVPFFFAAAAFGIARIRVDARAPVAVAILFVTVAVSATFGPWQGAPGNEPLWYQTELTPQHRMALDRAVALIPDGVPLSASNRVGAHVADRRYLYTLPTLGRAEWVLLDSTDLWLPDERLPALRERTPGELEALRRRIDGEAAWVRVYANDGVYVFRKRSA